MPDRSRADAERAQAPAAETPVCLFLGWGASTRVRAQGIEHALERFAPLASHLSTSDGFIGLHAHVPSDANDPYLKDTDAPSLVLQLYFDGVAALRRQCGQGSPLNRSLTDMLAEPYGTPASAGRASAATWQATRVERIDLEAAGPLPRVHCTYLVAYDGTSPDEAAWHAHYGHHHVPLMKRLPGLKRLEIHRPLALAGDVSALRSFERSTAMQRNQVVFDRPQALTAALNSPIRHEMRQDHLRSPPFEGRSTHYPMATRSWP